MLDAIQRLIDLGGPVVVVLLILSVVGVAAIVYKLIHLQPLSRSKFDALEAALEADQPTVLADGSNALERLLTYALNEKRKGRDPDRLEAELSRRGSRIIGDCSSFLRLIELIAYLCPLLGLFGTVLGMIDAFRGLEVEAGQGNAGVLAGGIWEALLTTALGLGIAVPMTAAHALLESRVQKISDRLKDILEQTLNG